MSTYQLGTKEQQKTVKKILEAYHEDLVSAGVTVEILQAFVELDEDGVPTGVPLSDKGYACAARIRVNGLRDRAKGLADVEVLLDGMHWEELTDRRRQAICDQQLARLELKVDEHGEIARDALARPRLRVRPYDRAYFWIDRIAERWGSDSTEVVEALDLRSGPAARVYQLELPFAAAAKHPKATTKTEAHA